MSEPIPESIPRSADPRSKRPLKKARPTPTSAQSDAVSALFEKQPDIEIPITATRQPKSSSSLAPPPEIVTNVQGSSAGAGSGEFHVYKASRRREYERIRLMEEEANREEADRIWEEEQIMKKSKDASKTSKNRKRREKAKGKKMGTASSAEATGLSRDGKLQPMQSSKSEDDEGDGVHGQQSLGKDQTDAADSHNGIIIQEDD